VIEPLDEGQRAALRTLATVVDPSTYVGGGVAVAIHLGHRHSRDLDLFTSAEEPVASIDRLADPTLGVRILDRAPGTLHLEVRGIPASVLRYRYPMLAEPERISGIPLAVAAIDDLVCMKLSAIAGRGAARDFWDLHAMLSARAMTLRGALEAYQLKYVTEDIGHVIRSLVYFADAEAGPLPEGLTDTHWARIQADFRDWTREL
jgi:hypothetical protein